MSASVGRKCICQICNCGNHKCPHSSYNFINQGAEPCKFSKYYEDYTEKHAEKQQSFKPQESAFRSDAPLDTNTTYKDYQVVVYLEAHNIEKTASMKPEQTAFRSDAPFEGLTENTAQYYEKQAERSLAARPVQAPLVTGAFDGTTTHNADFTQKQAEQAQSFKPANQAYRSSDPFDAVTSHRAEYTEKQWRKVVRLKGERAQNYRPNAERLEPGAFEGQTSHQADYTPKEGKPRSSYRPNATRHAPEGAFEGRTEASEQFVEKNADVQRAFRPNQEYRPSSAAFEKNTTYGDGYVPKFGERPENFKPAQTAFRSDAPFEGDTTYRYGYTEKKGDICPAGKLIAAHRDAREWHIGSDGHKYYLRNGRESPAMAATVGRPNNAAQAINPNAQPITG